MGDNGQEGVERKKCPMMGGKWCMGDECELMDGFKFVSPNGNVYSGKACSYKVGNVFLANLTNWVQEMVKGEKQPKIYRA